MGGTFIWPWHCKHPSNLVIKRAIRNNRPLTNEHRLLSSFRFLFCYNIVRKFCRRLAWTGQWPNPIHKFKELGLVLINVANAILIVFGKEFAPLPMSNISYHRPLGIELIDSSINIHKNRYNFAKTLSNHKNTSFGKGLLQFSLSTYHWEVHKVTGDRPHCLQGNGPKWLAIVLWFV